jgi:putative acetyltransferase
VTDVIVRAEAVGEDAQVATIIGAAFGRESVVPLFAAMRTSSAWRGLSYVATVADIPVAHAALTRGWLDAPTKLVEVLILSPVSVAPAWQRQGIGSELVAKTLEFAATRLEPLVFLEGDPAFYSRVGFRPGFEAGFIAPSRRIPERAFQFFALPRFESWMTGTLVYPDVFWEMDAVGLRGEVARLKGLEPPTSSSGGKRSIH